MKNKTSILKEEVFKECLYLYNLMKECDNDLDRLDLWDDWALIYGIIKRAGLEQEYLEYSDKGEKKR